jgi:hypothetical protein
MIQARDREIRALLEATLAKLGEREPMRFITVPASPFRADGVHLSAPARGICHHK